MTETVVIYRLGSLGDTIVTRLFPDKRKVLLTNKPISTKAAPIESILGVGTGFFDTAIAYPVNTRSPSVLFKLWRELRATGSDTLVYLTQARTRRDGFRDWLFFRSAGFKNIIGLPLTEDLINWRLGPDGLYESESNRLVRCLAPYHKIDLNDPTYWDLRLNAAELAAGQAIIAPFGGAPYIAINMGGKEPIKDWGVDNWTALIAGLRDDFRDHGLLFVGAAEDGPRADAVGAQWQGPVVNGCGRLSPRESGAAMRGAAVFIGHDSGPLHLAAAMNVVCVGVFGNFNVPVIWHPFGRHHRIIHNMDGVMAIQVAEVDSTVRAVLGARVSSEVA